MHHGDLLGETANQACEVPLEHKRIAHQTAQNTAGDFMKITTVLRVAEGLRNV